jgi:uncharacterized protein (DUF1810 family)
MAVEEGRTAHAVFGSPDDLKFRSLDDAVGRADPANAVFREALGRYLAGEEDRRMATLLD